MRIMRVPVMLTVTALAALLWAAPSGGESQGDEPVALQRPDPTSDASAKPAHANAATVDWTVSGTGERRSNRIIGSELIPDDDVRVGLFELAPRAIYAGHVHPVPEFYVVLEGQIEWTLGNETFLAAPGEFIYIAPNTLHRMVNLTDDIAQAVWGRWTPNGDRSVHQGEYRYVEPIPEQPPDAVLFPKPGQ